MRRTILMLMVAVIMTALAAAPALAFNPQPDPPRWRVVAFNPQPDPPIYLPGVEKVQDVAR